MHATGGGCVGISTLFQATSEVMEVLYQVTRKWYTRTDKSLVFRDAATLSCNEVVVCVDCLCHPCFQRLPDNISLQ